MDRQKSIIRELKNMPDWLKICNEHVRIEDVSINNYDHLVIGNYAKGSGCWLYFMVMYNLDNEIIVNSTLPQSMMTDPEKREIRDHLLRVVDILKKTPQIRLHALTNENYIQLCEN
jgi:hypothetical protein